jgi:aminoglycoside phosphotransferase
VIGQDDLGELHRRLIARSGLDATGQPGEPATAVEYRVDAERTVRLLGETLARLHAVELAPDECSAALTPERIAASAAEAVAAGRVASDRTPAYAHLPAERLLQVLTDGAPQIAARSEPPVLTHGAPTLSNLRCERGSAVGFVEWDAVAVADRYRDLAVAARSVARHLVPILVPVLFEHYRASSPDPVRLDWYSLAAELLVPSGADQG